MKQNEDAADRACALALVSRAGDSGKILRSNVVLSPKISGSDVGGMTVWMALDWLVDPHKLRSNPFQSRAPAAAHLHFYR